MDLHTGAIIMNEFESVVVKYGDQEARIPPERVLRVAAAVEDYLPYGKFISVYAKVNDFQMFKSAVVTLAYCSLLSCAGIPHNQRDVALKIANGELGDAMSSLLSLYDQLCPPPILNADSGKTAGKKKTKKVSAKPRSSKVES